LVRLPSQPEELGADELEDAIMVSTFLRQHIYGRSRMLPLSALLQRQFRPTAPLTYHRDSLLLQAPEWLEPRVQQLESLFRVRQIDARIRHLERLQRALAMAEEDGL
jgi:hypothetical protein